MHRKFKAKQTAILRRKISSQQNDKHPNECQQRLPQTFGCHLGRFVRRYNHCKYPHISECENKEKSKIPLKNIGKG